MLRVIFILLFSLLSVRSYADNVDLLDKKNHRNDDMLKKGVNDSNSICGVEGYSDADANNYNHDEGFYGFAYARFKEMYNTNLSVAEKKYLRIEDEEVSTLRGSKQITLRKIREGSDWWEYKHKFYSSDKYYLYRPVYELYRPYDFLFYSTCNDCCDCDLGVESGYRRFDFLKRNVFDMPINDVKTPIVRISSAVDIWQSPRGYISSFEYSFSINRNFHLGFVWDIVPLPRYYNKIYFLHINEGGLEDDKKPPYNYNFNYLFFSPFYLQALYKTDDERFISYFNVSYKHFKVNESGGSSTNEAGVVQSSNYLYNSSRASKFDVLISRQDSYSFFHFSQYRSDAEWRCYFLFDFVKEKNNVEVMKDIEVVLPPSIKGNKNYKDKEKYVPRENEYKYFFINKETVDVLKLGDKINARNKHYSSSSRFSRHTFGLGVENMPLLFLHIDIFAKVSLCVFPTGVEESIDGVNNFTNIEDRRIYEPIMGFVLRAGLMKIRFEILFDDFKLKPYFKCVAEAEGGYVRLLKLMVLKRGKTVANLLTTKVAGNIDKETDALLYFLTRKINIAGNFSFAFLTRILMRYNGFYNGTRVRESGKFKLLPVHAGGGGRLDDNLLEEGVFQNGSPILLFNFGLKFKIKVMRNFFFRSLIFINKKIIGDFFSFLSQKKRNANVERCDNLPLFSCFVKLYYKRRMKDNCNSFLSYGLQIKYHTFYYPDEFCILTQQWYNHRPIVKDLNNKNIELPVVDLFLNFRLGWFDISWEVTDLIQFLFDYTSILSPYYIRRPCSPFNLIISFITLN